jgi:hypothetical protein
MLSQLNDFNDSVELNGIAGDVFYLELLQQIHHHLQPNFYLEIGIRHGRSLSLAKCPAIGIDPVPEITESLSETCQIIATTSDDFFATQAKTAITTNPDLVFIDGMHWFEYALRDFMHVEQWAHSATVVIIDDIFPNHSCQATRIRTTRVWMGDVWKLHACLKKYRPDLYLLPLNSNPSGLLMITNLDSNNRVLWNNYNAIVDEYLHLSEIPPSFVLQRTEAIVPKPELIQHMCERYRKWRLAAYYVDVSQRLPMSIIVAAYNMARELPRTLLSLSPNMQRDIEAQDYEIIVVDNGSTQWWDEFSCRNFLPKLKIQRQPHSTLSPVNAINRAIASANGELIGVWIDGARLASPGILQLTRKASQIHKRSVIGTLGFHLGPDAQQRSSQQGYNQAQEDALLQKIKWEKNGYRLFDIASFAGSTKDGWFMPIGETNSLFLNKNMWQELDGYDERFQMPGGGLANLDVWRRACLAKNVQVIILLGEGTFHQIHTNAATTNTAQNMYLLFDEEYRTIRGEPYTPPRVAPLYFGNVPPQTLPKLAWSIQHAMNNMDSFCSITPCD